ncbi:hypothetical protein AB0H76_33980 [Nocardia sp. NPDC050712]|uniref:hypothetical protein n=1 Tax=Nocardia sp. NPDC050712 TaxID=3155518 RepID=UPI0033CF8B0D
MTPTTPPRAVDVAAVCPALVPLARPATRLHPRRGTPSAYDSSIGGPLLWPADESWPHCHGPHGWHLVTDPLNPHGLNPLQSLADAKLQRDSHMPSRRMAEFHASSGGTFTAEEWETIDRLERGVPLPEGPNAMLAVAQLYTRDVPGLRPPPGKDLLQILWCPLDNAEGMPETTLVWRSAADVTDILTAPPEPAAVEYGYDYVPVPCTVEPECIVEYPNSGDLRVRGGEPLEQVRRWAVQHAGVDVPVGLEVEAGFERFDELCVAPGWKVGGHIRWGLMDPFPQPCPTCGTETEPLLTMASTEWDGATRSWIPYEDQALEAGTAIGPGVTIARGYNMILRVCPASPDHPHIQLIQ